MTTKLRIALDYRPALLGRSGVPRAARELSQALAADERIECRNFAHSFGWARVPPPNGTRLRRLPIPGRSLRHLSRLGLTAERLVGGADVVHWTDFVLPPTAASTPVVFTAHDLAAFEDPSYHGRGSQALIERTRFAAERAQRVVTPTETIARAVTEHLGLPPERVTSIPWGLNHDGCWPKRSESGGSHLLCVGTIEPRKNHLAILRAWRQLGEDRPKLLVLGKLGWEAERIATALEAAADDGSLEWRRDASDHELETAFRDALGLIYLSSYEGFGFPPLEALARGLPTLIGDAESCRESTSGLATSCNPQDDESVLEGLRALLEAPRTDEAIARRVQHARGFTWSNCASRYADVYREVAG